MPKEYNFDRSAKTGRWTIEVDTSAKYGYFERDSDGSGGGLWFGTTEAGQLTLEDYDGMACLPKPVTEALRGLGLQVDPEFE